MSSVLRCCSHVCAPRLSVPSLLCSMIGRCQATVEWWFNSLEPGIAQSAPICGVSSLGPHRPWGLDCDPWMDQNLQCDHRTLDRCVIYMLHVKPLSWLVLSVSVSVSAVWTELATSQTVSVSDRKFHNCFVQCRNVVRTTSTDNCWHQQVKIGQFCLVHVGGVMRTLATYSTPSSKLSAIIDCCGLHNVDYKKAQTSWSRDYCFSL